MKSIIVKTKKEFKKQILKMKCPIMTEHDFGNMFSNTSLTIMVADKETNFRFYMPTIKYMDGVDFELYIKKENEYKQKYERWMYEYCGNYCLSKLNISGG